MDMAIKKADEKMSFISNDKDALRLYQMREMALSDYTSGMNHAKRENAKEIAKNALRKGFDIKDISEITGLDELTIKSLQTD